MFCSGCGKLMPDGSAFCPQCGRPSGAPASAGAVAVAAPAVAPPYAPASPAGSVAVAPGLAYAGFWLRLVAYIIDALILGLCFGTVFVVLAVGSGLGSVLQNLQNGPDLGPFFAGTFFVTLMLSCPAQNLIFPFYDSRRSLPTCRELGKAVNAHDIPAIMNCYCLRKGIAGQKPGEIARAVGDAVSEFCEGTPQSDDVTIVVTRFG